MADSDEVSGNATGGTVRAARGGAPLSGPQSHHVRLAVRHRPADEPCPETRPVRAVRILAAGGGRLVRNESHAEPSDHEYRVTLAAGEPTRCECPADEHYDGPCKHRTAVTIRSQIGAVAADVQAVVDAKPAVEGRLLGEQECAETGADGSSEQNGDDGPEESTRPADCECRAFNSNIDLACWPCYRAGFEAPAPDADDPS